MASDRSASLTLRRGGGRLHRPVLVAVPVLTAMATPLAVYAWALAARTFHDPWEAIWISAESLVASVEQAGLASVAILLLTWLCAHGILIVVCLLASRRWPPRRVWCLLVFGLLGPLLIEGPVHVTRWQQAVDMNITAVSWFFFTGRSSPWMFLGMLIGWIVSLHPFVKRGDRYWLARGLCPRCRYDLKVDLEAGCPECGWKRGDTSAGAAAPARHEI